MAHNYSEFLVRLGTVVRRRRKDKGLSQSELAANVDVEQPTIHRIEKGTQGWDSSTLYNLARALDTSIADLMAEAEDVVPAKLPREAIALGQLWMKLPGDMRSSYMARIEGLAQALAVPTPDEKIDSRARSGATVRLPSRGDARLRHRSSAGKRRRA